MATRHLGYGATGLLAGLCIALAGASVGAQQLVIDLNPGLVSSQLADFVVFGDELFFAADDGGGEGRELWKTDGTAAGTVLVKNIFPGHPNGSNPGRYSGFAELNGELFFGAFGGPTLGTELWKTDGTTAGTVLVRDIRPGYGLSSSPAHLTGFTLFNGELYFPAKETASGVELWKTDGTRDGTVLVRNLTNGDADPTDLVALNGELLFSAYHTDRGRELWKTDGTWAGTVLVKDIAPGSGGSAPAELTFFGGGVFFRADDGTGTELWKTNGTGGGTVRVAEIHPTGGSDPSRLTPLGGQLLCFADDGVHGRELWSTNGTVAGTFLVRDIHASGGCVAPPLTGSIAKLTEMNGELFFFADDGTNGVELWKTDGSAGGTVMLKDIHPGFRDSGQWLNENEFVMYGNELFFAANDGANGPWLANFELWRTDGTTGGTLPIGEIHPSQGSAPNDLTLFDGRLFCGAFDGISGRELWVVGNVAGRFQPFGTGCPLSFGTHPNLNGVGDPRVGARITYRVTSVPTIGSVLFFGSSDTSWGTVGLPLSLGFMGLNPSCMLYTGVEVALPFNSLRPFYEFSWKIPNKTTFIGTQLYTQAWIHDPNLTTATPAATSNGLRTLIGGYR